MKHYQYKIISKGGSPTEPIAKEQDWVIEKTGGTVEFTLNDIKKDIENMKKIKTEMEAKAKIEGAMMENVATNYPDVPKIDEKIRVAVFLYQKSWATKKMCDERVSEMDKQLVVYADEIQEILKQTHLSLEEKTTEQKVEEIVKAPVMPEKNAQDK